MIYLGQKHMKNKALACYLRHDLSSLWREFAKTRSGVNGDYLLDTSNKLILMKCPTYIMLIENNHLREYIIDNYELLDYGSLI